jgi:hypothetical protein
VGVVLSMWLKERQDRVHGMLKARAQQAGDVKGEIQRIRRDMEAVAKRVELQRHGVAAELDYVVSGRFMGMMEVIADLKEVSGLWSGVGRLPSGGRCSVEVTINEDGNYETHLLESGDRFRGTVRLVEGRLAGKRLFDGPARLGRMSVEGRERLVLVRDDAPAWADLTRDRSGGRYT